jgi:tRNA nucleotidyltransferase/poly(A) polymerase
MPVPSTAFPTPDTPVSLKGADWLADERLQQLMRVIAGTDEDIRIVGGAVRNWLMRREVADIDLATTASPQIVTARARQAGMKPVATGIDHGTVTVVVDGTPFEVTTLREDVATDGRHAAVEFGRDWATDARRRDFTVNALYATADGDVVDLIGGIADCMARRIRFIGDPDARIREDYLRILRLFRFHATFSDGPIDPDGLAASIRLRDGLRTLSAERIGHETLKLVMADHAPDVLEVMHDTGILSLVLGTERIDLNRFRHLHAAIASLKTRLDASLPSDLATLSLASLSADGAAGCELFSKRLRLSNAARNRMVAAWTATRHIASDLSERDARATIARVGGGSYGDSVLLAASTPDQNWPITHIADLLRLGEVFAAQAADLRP